MPEHVHTHVFHLWSNHDKLVMGREQRMSLIFRRSWLVGEDVEMSSHLYVSRLGGPRWQQTHFCTVTFPEAQGNTGLSGMSLPTQFCCKARLLECSLQP